VEQSATAGELFDQAAGEPVLLRVSSGRAFVLVEVDSDDAETLTLADNAKFNEILSRSRARARREGWLSTEQVREQLRTG
jgi:uncharacterized membrane protein YkoI